MSARMSRLLVPFLLLSPAVSLAQVPRDPVRLTRDTVSPAVWGVVATPAHPGPHAGVILLPGSAGSEEAAADASRRTFDFLRRRLEMEAADATPPSRTDGRGAP